MEGYVISCFEELVAPKSKGGVLFVGHLKACYEEGVLTEETIVAWWIGASAHTEPLVDTRIRARLQRVSAPLIDCLAQEENGSDCIDERQQMLFNTC
eukprot:scaffold370_cov176-Amphora_coffeaeformis.AAC.21